LNPGARVAPHGQSPGYFLTTLNLKDDPGAEGEIPFAFREFNKFHRFSTTSDVGSSDCPVKLEVLAARFRRVW
jgi:hypothetical protein